MRDQDQYQIPSGFINSGSKNPDVVGQWTSHPEIQQTGVVLEARTPDTPQLISAHDTLNGVLKLMGEAPILTVETEPEVDRDSAEILSDGHDVHAMRDNSVNLSEVA